MKIENIKSFLKYEIIWYMWQSNIEEYHRNILQVLTVQILRWCISHPYWASKAQCLSAQNSKSTDSTAGFQSGSSLVNNASCWRETLPDNYANDIILKIVTSSSYCQSFNSKTVPAHNVMPLRFQLFLYPSACCLSQGRSNRSLWGLALFKRCCNPWWKLEE